jgi:hypothetical protein
MMFGFVPDEQKHGVARKIDLIFLKLDLPPSSLLIAADSR